MYYILENKKPKLTSPTVWRMWNTPENKRVALNKIGDIDVSTVFLGVDYGFNSTIPVLFETMVFGGPDDQYCERYCTYEEAEKGHDRIVNMVKGSNILKENDLI